MSRHSHCSGIIVFLGCGFLVYGNESRILDSVHRYLGSLDEHPLKPFITLLGQGASLD
jgi:hypothetical protein